MAYIIGTIFKRFVAAALIMSMLLLNFQTISFASHITTAIILTYDGKTVIHEDRPVTLKLNGQTIAHRLLQPVVIDDYTFVSAREVFEFFGAVVDWKAETEEVYIGYKNRLLILKLNSPYINIDGVIKIIPSAPKLINDYTMIPVRAAAEAFGFSVGFDADTYTVKIDNEDYSSGTTGEPVTSGQTGDSSSAIDISSGLTPKSLETAVDRSPGITTENNPVTTIDNIIIPSSQLSNVYTIAASSRITKVDKFLLPDNRLVIDIYNAEMKLPKTTYECSTIFLRTVRAGQNQVTPQMITRIVFDLSAAVSFRVTLTSDRKNILVSFEDNVITGVSLQSDASADYITIEGTSQPVVSVYPLGNPDRIVIDIPLTQILDISTQTGSGRFVSSVRKSQYDADTARIVADLSRHADYSVSYSGNKAVIRIAEPTYQNVEYNPSTRMLAIPKSSGIRFNIGAVSHIDNYIDFTYYLTLPDDFTASIGFGEKVIKDGYINSFEIMTINGRTTIKINEAQILAFDVLEDTGYYYIKAMKPKEKYKNIVVIDPGHGGSDPGTSGFGNVEKDVNLALSLRLINMLELNPNIKVYSTRLSDVYPTREARAEFANAVGDLFVSIHNNYFDNPDVSGTEVYYYPHANDSTIGISSKTVADITHGNLISDLKSVDRKVRSSKFVVLNLTTVPAILCEIGFLSNYEECMKVTDPAYQQKTAEALYRSIVQVFDIYRPSR